MCIPPIDKLPELHASSVESTHVGTSTSTSSSQYSCSVPLANPISRATGCKRKEKIPTQLVFRTQQQGLGVDNTPARGSIRRQEGDVRSKAGKGWNTTDTRAYTHFHNQTTKCPYACLWCSVSASWYTRVSPDRNTFTCGDFLSAHFQIPYFIVFFFFHSVVLCFNVPSVVILFSSIGHTTVKTKSSSIFFSKIKYPLFKEQ